jgi:enoyl-CoA hydratase/carnithine racemase
MVSGQRSAGGAVLSSRSEGVLRLVLNRPHRRNAVDSATSSLLHELLTDARDDPTVRVIVLSGAGPAFCAGWDIDAIAELRDGDEPSVRAEFERNRRLLDDLETAPQATIACVHGAVMGFGLGLVASCDIAVAARSATVALPEIELGVVPGMVMLDVLEAVPAKVALDWLLSGERQPADRALAAGLLSRVVEDDALEPTVGALAERLAAHDPGTVRETKHLFRRLRGLDRSTAEAEAIAGAVAALLRA